MGKDAQTGESDSRLLVRLQGGDPEAFEVLFERHRRGVRAYAAAILRDAALAEDVTQESFLELVRRVQEVDARRGVTGWLYRVARNRAIDVQRHRRHDVQPGAEAVTRARDEREQAPSAADDLQRREQDAHVTAAMAALPAEEREVLALHYFAGLAYRDVAAVVDRPLGTVLWRAHRGLGRMRREMMRSDA
ncbi:MAG: RNA polymerase sigma factor [Lentisphaerae bacterium]|nr:RNA polymerase sigma factor [Lentisphaerota bacterium]